MSNSNFVPYDTVSATLEKVLAASVADETELVWLQRRHGRVASGQPGRHDSMLSSILVRVVEGKRLGWYRTDNLCANELESGLRHALALAKAQAPAKRGPIFFEDSAANAVLLPTTVTLRDETIEQLDTGAAAHLLSSWCAHGEVGRLHWSASRLAIINSHGLRRSAAATEISVELGGGRHQGAGWAAGSARSIEDLARRGIAGRARAMTTENGAGTVAQQTHGPILFSPEATIMLLDLLNGHAFAGRAFLDGTSFLSRHRNVQVFDRAFNLRDDGTEVSGLPFPFDLEGATKRPLDLIVDGKPSTPALNRHQGQEAGLRSTGQAVGGEDSLFGNLFLLPGSSSDDDLLAAADGGLRIGWLERPECLDPAHLQIRATARGVRRIVGGRLAEPVTDLVIEGSLLRMLARLVAIGKEPVTWTRPTTPLGAISAPALVAQEIESLRPL